MKRAKASQRGFTLVELMVSIVAGLIAFGAPTIDRESPPPAGW